MRKIKFRAWNKKIKSMGSALPLDVLISDCTDINYDDLEIMQYTCLKDKNGKEIYEGDVVKGQFITTHELMTESHIGYEMGGVVFYDYAGFRLDCMKTQNLCDKDRYGQCNYFDFLGDEGDFTEMEVIGNIYENPELIEK